MQVDGLNIIPMIYKGYKLSHYGHTVALKLYILSMHRPYFALASHFLINHIFDQKAYEACERQ